MTDTTTNLSDALNVTPEPEVDPVVEASEEAIPEPQEAKEAEAVESVEEPKMVPLKALHEARDQTRHWKEIAEQRVQAPQQQPAEQPDPIADPEGYAEHVRRTTVNTISLNNANRVHGAPAVQQAFAALRASGDQAVINAMSQSADPYADMVDWHQRQVQIAELGDDPLKVIAAQKAEIERLKSAQQVVEGVKTVPPPGSLAGQTSIGERTAPFTPTSLEDAIG